MPKVIQIGRQAVENAFLHLQQFSSVTVTKPEVFSLDPGKKRTPPKVAAFLKQIRLFCSPVGCLFLPQTICSARLLVEVTTTSLSWSARLRCLRPCGRSGVVYGTSPALSLPSISTTVRKHNQHRQISISHEKTNTIKAENAFSLTQRPNCLSRRAAMARSSRLQWTASRLSTLQSSCLAAR